MSKPNKKRGFRNITVNDEKFTWCFAGYIDIRSVEFPRGQKLKVDFGWYDIWLHVNDPIPPPKFDPKVATPKFVEQAIKFAKTQKWDFQNNSGVFEIVYRDSEFKIRH